MLFTEFNMEDALEGRYEEGRNEGIRAFILDYLEDGKTEEQTSRGRNCAGSLNRRGGTEDFGLYNNGKPPQ